MKTYEKWGGESVFGESVFAESVFGESEIGRKSRQIFGVANKFSAYH
jgi:hypothetical protein